MKFIFFIICFFLAFKTSNEYLTETIVINRPANNGAMADGFRKMASGSFPMENKVNCSEFNAEMPYGVHSTVNQCKCGDGKATFSFYDGKWLCVDNEGFRERQGM